MENLVGFVESQYQKKEIPVFRQGDTVKIHYKIVEGESERTQIFEGTVLRMRGAGISKTITVRKISFGVGIERIFLLNSPRIENIEIVKQGKVRRSRLYYLRGLSGKSARIEEKNARQGSAAPQETGLAEKPVVSEA
ncbi:MAG: 50S ribosomal protein L19 [Elusimicrobia bacterium]|nr:50S ribosomal protein L19 [Elusimicrobiota bacterium]